MKLQTAKVNYVATKNIKPNPHNPRRLFDEEPMRILKESIEKLGILVPLDIYPENPKIVDPKSSIFVLLDGERRWRCANALGLEEIPCIIVDTPSKERNILTMFHIHNVREGWQLMPTALKLKDLMSILDTDNERALAELTKLSISQVRRCKQLLTYPEKYQNRMLAPPSERFKADFFIDLHRFRGPALKDNFKPWVSRGDDKCIDVMIEKYEKNIIKAVTEFRFLASIYKDSIERKKINEFTIEFENFLDTLERGIADIYVPGASYAHGIKEISRSTKRLFSQLSDINIEDISSNEQLINDLKELQILIKEKLENALLDQPKENFSK